MRMVQKLVFMLGLFGLAALAGQPAHAERLYERVLRCTGNPCVVERNLGGILEPYLAAAKEIQRDHISITIDGMCSSSCSILADKVRENVCITSAAEFGFHKVRDLNRIGRRFVFTGHRENWRYSKNLQKWINKQGGEPGNALLVMNNEAAGYFWRRCSSWW